MAKIEQMSVTASDLYASTFTGPESVYLSLELCRRYSKVKEWTLGLSGGGSKIAVIRAVGGISRARGGGLSVGGEGIVSDTFVEKIRTVRGIFLAFSHPTFDGLVTLVVASIQHVI
jgi:hypothetical protein